MSEFVDIIQYYLDQPDTLEITLSLFRSSSNDEILGFVIRPLIGIKFLPNDNSLPNTYVIATGFACISLKARKFGLQRKYYNSIGLQNIKSYPNRNILHFDVSINPLTYLGIIQACNIVYPKIGLEKNEKIELFAKKLMKVFDYEPEEGQSEYLDKDSYANYDEMWRNYTKNENKIKGVRVLGC